MLSPSAAVESAALMVALDNNINDINLELRIKTILWKNIPILSKSQILDFAFVQSTIDIKE